MANRFETIPVPYPAQVLMRGGRKEYPAFLIAEAAVAIPTGPAPEQVMEIKMPGQRPPQFAMPNEQVLDWIGEPWRYHIHPATGQLLTDWRPSIWESSGSHGIYAQRATMPLDDLLEGFGVVLDGQRSVSDRNMAVGPAHNPFVDKETWVAASLQEQRLVLPEGVDAKRLDPTPGARDAAIATASRLAREMYLTDDGRLLVPTNPPRLQIGGTRNEQWIIPSPGELLVGWASGRDGNRQTYPINRPDLACADRYIPITNLIRFGTIKIASGYSPEQDLPREMLDKAVSSFLRHGAANSMERHLRLANMDPVVWDPVEAAWAGVAEARAETEAWSLQEGRDPAELIDSLASFGHRHAEFCQRVQQIQTWPEMSGMDDRVTAIRSVRGHAISGHGPGPNADRILRIVGCITGLPLPHQCIDLIDPKAAATPDDESQPSMQTPR